MILSAKGLIFNRIHVLLDGLIYMILSVKGYIF